MCGDGQKKIGDLLELYQETGDILPLRQRIENLMPDDNHNEPVRQYDNESLYKLALQMKKGVSIATPVLMEHMSLIST